MTARKPVRVLPPEVHNQIAAGEVIERPASVVKELVENALDAGADRIVVTIADGGKSLIRVSDNGAGMSREDALLAIRRHATSKISRAADLFALSTFGFRGEALPSIAAVSRFTLETRPRESREGVKISCEDGREPLVETAGLPVGTTVTVEDLFANLPARRKFLKTTNTERGAVIDCLNRFSLVYHRCTFILHQDGRTVFNRSGTGEPAVRVREVIGRQAGDRLLPLAGGGAAGEPTVSGFVSAPELRRPNRRSIYLFVNQRPVRDQLLIQALMKAYQGLLERGRYPVAVLFLQVDPAGVDVNVHPAKEEVRFAEPGRIFSLVQRAVQEVLSGYRLPGGELAGGDDDPFARLPGRDGIAAPANCVPRVDAADFPRLELPREDEGAFRSWIRENSPVFGGDSPPPAARSEAGEPTPAAAGEAAGTGGFFASLAIVGQIWDSYLVLSDAERLYFIDQHAAHERVLFDRLRTGMAAGGASQQLLLPVNVELSPAELAAAAEYRPAITALGFQFEPFGQTGVVLTGVPVLAADYDAAELLRQVLHDLVASRGRLQPARLTDELAARFACRLAVKAGRRLAFEEVGMLLRELDRTASGGHTCPHGRPLYFTLTKSELEKRFGRH
ncbi:MAG: DNA mismatch repair endonuclease MutL [Deltaproteobacteria bacterium]|nr:DNA mismatch repair endonuclease MutL [Deltaproteobacteria bacterium]